MVRGRLLSTPFERRTRILGVGGIADIAKRTESYQYQIKARISTWRVSSYFPLLDRQPDKIREVVRAREYKETTVNVTISNPRTNDGEWRTAVTL